MRNDDLVEDTKLFVSATHAVASEVTEPTQQVNESDSTGTSTSSPQPCPAQKKCAAMKQTDTISIANEANKLPFVKEEVDQMNAEEKVILIHRICILHLKLLNSCFLALTSEEQYVRQRSTVKDKILQIDGFMIPF